jgi:hypothetical protein
MSNYRDTLPQSHLAHLGHGTHHPRVERNEDGYNMECSRDSFSMSGLQNIEEHLPMANSVLSAYAPPETPQEPMEFLARSWSISAVDVQRALAPVTSERQPPGQSSPESILETPPFRFASGITPQLVMDRVLTHGAVSVSSQRFEELIKSSLVSVCFYICAHVKEAELRASIPPYLIQLGHFRYPVFAY